MKKKKKEKKIQSIEEEWKQNQFTKFLALLHGSEEQFEMT